MTDEISWTARLASEKARARRLVAARKAVIAQTIHETYIGKRGIVNYEAWDVVETAPLSSHQSNASGNPAVSGASEGKDNG